MKPQSIVAVIFASITLLNLPVVQAQVSARSEAIRLIPPIGHTRPVSDIQASRDGRLAASISWDGSALLWQGATGRIIRRFPLTAKGRFVRFSNDSSALLTVEDNSHIDLWDIETGKFRWSIVAPIKIESVSLRPDGKAVVISGTDPASKDAPMTVIYQTDSGALLQTLGPASEISRAGVTNALYSADGATLYGYNAEDFQKYQGTADATPNPLSAFAADSGKKRPNFTASGAAIAASKDGKFLLTKGKGKAFWCDAMTGAVIRTFQQEMTGAKEPQNMTLSPDGSRIATVTNGGEYSPEGTIREYSIATGTILRKTMINGVGPDNSLVYLPGNTQSVLVTLNAAREPFCQVNLATQGVVRNFRGGAGRFRMPSTLSPDGKTVFLRNGTETGVVGWDVQKRSWSTFVIFPPEKTAVSSSPPLAEAMVSRDGNLIVTPGISDKHVFVSDVRTNTTLADIPITIDELSVGVAIHPTGAWVAIPTAESSYRNTVKLFSPKGVLLREIQPPAIGNSPLFIRAVASDASGERLLISDYDGRLFVYAAETGNLLRTIPSTSPVKASREAISAISVIGTEKDRILIVRDSGQAAEVDLTSGEVSPRDLGPVVAGPTLASTTSDGTLIALGRPDGSILLWQRNTSNTRLLTGHTGRLTTLAFSSDGRRLTSLGRDGLVRFWDTGTGKEQAALLVFTRKPSVLSALLLDTSKADREELLADIPQWIAYTPSGLFEGSEAATSQIHFAKGTQTYSADQFFEQFYRTGLLMSVLSDTKPVPVPGPSHDILDSLRIGTPPLVKIASPVADGKKASTATVSITVNAIEQAGGGVKAIRLYQNGRLIGGPSVLRGIVVEAVVVNGATTSKTFTVSLTTGANEFRAVAYSKSDLESVPATLSVTYSPPQIVKPVLHVLTVGINTYKDSAMNLSYARPDAEALAAFFEKTGSRPDTLFRSVSVTRLMDREATATAIAEKLAILSRTAKPEDVVFLYFAGHGETADGSWYFLPQEMRQMALPERVKELGIPWSQIETAVGKIAARKIVLVVDACKSGAALSSTLRGTDDEAQTMAVMARAQGIHILTASTAQQYAAEVKELGHGILTYALLEGLNGKATSSGGVFVRTLMSYVEDRVPELSKQYRGGEQYPVPFERGQNFPLVAK
jgi:WD40 repeat protein